MTKKEYELRMSLSAKGLQKAVDKMRKSTDEMKKSIDESLAKFVARCKEEIQKNYEEVLQKQIMDNIEKRILGKGFKPR